MITLLDIKNSTIPNSVNLAPCNPAFKRLGNETQERLGNMGRWWGTMKRIRICVNEKCIAWPAGVSVVEGFNINGWGAPLRNGWFEFQDNVRAAAAQLCSCSPQQLLDRGMSPQFRNTTADSYIRIYPVSSADDDAVILLQGLDQNGNPIRGNTGDDYYDGEKVTLASPFATSTNVFLPPGLTGIQKPITKSYLKVFAVNAATDEETQIATWGPSETAPLYRRSAITQFQESDCSSRWNNDGYCIPEVANCQRSIADAIVRMTPIPMVVDTDWCFIGNLGAMKAGMKAMQKEDEGDYNGAGTEWLNAVKLLRAEINTYEPPERIQINPQTWGFSPIGRVLNGIR
jgi:hypothetical protein